MTDLNDSLQRMGFMQLVMLFGFLTTYVLALGGLLRGRARVHCACLAATCAVGFAGLTDPWVHGALLMVFVVAGLGLFVLVAWLLARTVAPAQPHAVAATPAVQSGPGAAQPAAVGVSAAAGELRWPAAAGQSKPT